MRMRTHPPVRVVWRRTESVENRGAVRVQAGDGDRLIAAHKQVGSRLIHSLFKKDGKRHPGPK